MRKKRRKTRHGFVLGKISINKWGNVWGKLVRFLKWSSVVVLIAVTFFIWRGYSTREWLGVEAYRLLWWSQAEDGGIRELKLYQYLPSEQVVVIYDIPTQAYVNLSDGYGNYQVQSILKLAEIENKSDDLLLKSMEKVFAYDIQVGIFSGEGEGGEMGNELLVQAVKSLLNPMSWEENGYDMLSAWWEMRNVSEGKQYLVDLEEQNLYERILDVDGVEKEYLSELMLDDLISRTVPPAVDEFFPIQVVVINTTKISGLASQMARLITHEGYDVVRVFDIPENLSVDELWFDNQELQESLAGKRLTSLIDSTVIKQEKVMDEYRAEVVIKIGNNSSR